MPGKYSHFVNEGSEFRLESTQKTLDNAKNASALLLVGKKHLKVYKAEPE